MSRPRAHRVTCICTAYNVGAYIRDAIASALAQDYEGELEIIAVAMAIRRSRSAAPLKP